ncbi:hypothetical protein L1987_64493 [Smallanthus sonchifolius]|uniref:Uncharacterized protein n=1 Tax=Smallanthus sonchifolius TaxID=185202 RepID=A0ACB9CG94_9ASTR|nr:hypothetical protein L1987_64493 [Smallanthus sonchifolius]
MWVLDQWRYFTHVMIMCLFARKAGKDAMGHDLAVAMVGLSLNKGYNFSKYIYKSITDQINDADSVEPTPEHTPLFGHLITEAYVALADFRWYNAQSEPGLSEHSDEQHEEQEAESEDDMSNDERDEELGIGGAEESDSETIESDSSDSDDAPSQAHPRILTNVEVSAQRQASVTATSTDSTSTSPSQHLYWRHRRRPRVTPDEATTAITEEVRVIVSLPVQSVQVAVITPILTESVTITPTTIQSTSVPTSIPTTTLHHISEPYHDFDFNQGFDFGEFFSFPTNQAEASSSRGPDPQSDKQHGQISSLIDEVAALKKQRAADDKQRLKHDTMVKLVCDMAKTLAAQGERLKEFLEKQPPKPSSEEACHLVDLTKGDDQDKDPEAGPSGSEQQSFALAIVRISTVSMAEGESTQSEGGGDASGGNKGKSVADVLKDISDDVSDDVILFLDPDYSKEAQIEALCNLEEGEIDSSDDWDEEDDDVVIEVPKGDEEG